jgi:tetratricopeptide (TPR) repeat protein
LPILVGLLPALAALLAYGGALDGDFVYDDHGSVFGNPRVALGDWWGMAFGPDHTSLANRPFACLTIVANHALRGMDAWSFRVGNLVLHIGCAWLLLGVVRRCLLAPNLHGRCTAARATWTAAAVATLWACHPLGADAVTYITQRSTLLMSAGLLGCLYGVLRHAQTSRVRWRVLAVLSMALGMASKEDLVAGPLLVVLFERAFLLPSWSALRTHRRFHLALASTWLVLLGCVLAGPANSTVGFDSLVKVSSLEWLGTQAGVIVHYLQVSVWPHALRGVYDWGIVRELGPAVAPGLVVLGLLAFTLWQWRQRPWLGWLGAMFFLLLAPTSSVMPIVTEVVAERRMYLPMLFVLVPAVLVIARVVDTAAIRVRPVIGLRAVLFAAATLVPVTAAIAVTRAYAPTFTTGARFWTDAYHKNALTNRSLLVATILSGYARVLDQQGRADESLSMLERAMACEHKVNVVVMNYAVALRARGRLADAERALRQLLHDEPDFAVALGGLAAVLVDAYELDVAHARAAAGDPRLDEVDRLTDRAYRLIPKPEFLNTRGMALFRQGRLPEAEAVLRLAILQDPAAVDAAKSLGAVLLFGHRPAEAIGVWRGLLLMLPQDMGLRMTLVAAHLQLEDVPAARELLAEVLRLEPGHAGARRALAELPSTAR